MPIGHPALVTLDPELQGLVALWDRKPKIKPRRGQVSIAHPVLDRAVVDVLAAVRVEVNLREAGQIAFVPAQASDRPQQSDR